jgi:trigger factor
MTATPESKSGVTAKSDTESPILRVLSVEVDEARVAKAFDSAYRDLGKRVNVRGFRPGKAPRSVLQKLYGPALAEDIERALIAETLPDAVELTGVEPVAEPSIDASPPVLGAPFSYTAKIEVRPEIELPDLQGLSAERPAVHVADDAVDGELERLRERRITLVDEPGDAVLAAGSFATIDYVGRIDGEGFEGGSAQGVTLEIGSERFIPGFEDQLVGAATGDDREVRVTFPEDYGAAHLAGKEAVFAVHVVGAKRREVPELDDEFAKGLGEFETLQALRDRIQSDLVAAAERESKQALRKSLLDGLLGRFDFPVPPGLVERRLGSRLEMAHRELHHSFPEDELHAQLGRWREEWRPDAERDVREELVLDAVGVAQRFEASEEAVDARLDELARDQGIDPQRLRKAYEEGGMREALAASLVRDQAFDWLCEQAEIRESSSS